MVRSVLCTASKPDVSQAIESGIFLILPGQQGTDVPTSFCKVTTQKYYCQGGKEAIRSEEEVICRLGSTSALHIMPVTTVARDILKSKPPSNSSHGMGMFNRLPYQGFVVFGDRVVDRYDGAVK